MSDDASGSLNSIDPLEDYMASFFCTPIREPLNSSVNTPLNSPSNNSITVQTTDLCFKNANPCSNKPAMISDITSAQSQCSLLPRLKKSAKKHSDNVSLHKAHVAQQLPSDILLDTHQKQNLQKLLDKTLYQPLLDVVQSPEANTLDAIDPNLNDSAILNAQVVQQVEAVSAVSLLPIEPKIGALNRPSAERVDYRSHWQNNKPSWAQNTFDALLFQCRGVTLAIPLVSLEHIYLHNEPLKQLPNLPTWVLGVKPLSQGSLKVIDAGEYFLPERAPSLNFDGELYVLAIADCLWGFAVDSLSNPISVKLDDVQWRTLNGHNPWLAGTIKKQMCVLVDTPALLAFLNKPSI